MKQNTALRLVISQGREVKPATTEMAISIQEFLVAFKQDDKTPGTVEKYGWHLERLAEWLAERHVTRPGQMTRLLLREWGAGLFDRWGASTVKQATCAARAFLKYLREEKLLDEPLADCLKLPKVESGEQRVLDIQEVQTVLASFAPDRALDVRDLAIISLLVDSGLRAAELCRLKESDLRFGVQLYDPETNQIVTVNVLSVVRKGKKRKQPAYFGEETAERIKAWLKVRPQLARPEAEELFVSQGGLKPGTHLTRDGLRAIIRTVAQRAGVKHFSPHALRRSFACLLVFAGANSRTIQLYGNWSNLKEVETYTQSLQAGGQYPRYSPMRLVERLRQAAEQGE
jgi:site-specific recombinase XerD